MQIVKADFLGVHRNLEAWLQRADPETGKHISNAAIGKN
jgi:hypothetical protein